MRDEQATVLERTLAAGLHAENVFGDSYGLAHIVATGLGDLNASLARIADSLSLIAQKLPDARLGAR